MPDTNLVVGSKSPLPISSSPSLHSTVTNAGPSTVYYKTTSNVSESLNDGSLAKGASVTFTAGVHWFITASGTGTLFVEHSPEYTTDMATQAELDARVPATVAGNVSLGTEALASNVTGIRNTALGAGALATVTGSDASVAVGYEALHAFKEGTTGTEGYDVAVGAFALGALTKGEGNVAIGYTAGSSLTTGDENVVIGTEALHKQTTVSGNVAVGFRALNENTSGEFNTVIGYQAAIANTTGHHNIVIGREALWSNLVGFQNIAIGGIALNKCTGSDNLGIGGSALKELTTGVHNLAIGQSTLDQIKAGNNNVAIGSGAGHHATEGSKENVFLGMEAGPTANGVINNKLYIHNEPSSEPLILGDFAAKELRLYTTKLGFYGVAPVARAAAIGSPEATTASLKTAVDAIRVALTNIGITS